MLKDYGRAWGGSPVGLSLPLLRALRMIVRVPTITQVTERSCCTETRMTGRVS